MKSFICRCLIEKMSQRHMTASCIQVSENDMFFSPAVHLAHPRTGASKANVGKLQENSEEMDRKVTERMTVGWHFSRRAAKSCLVVHNIVRCVVGKENQYKYNSSSFCSHKFYVISEK